MISEISKTGDKAQLVAVGRLLKREGLPVSDFHQVDWLALLVWTDGDNILGAGGIQRCGDSILLRSIVTDRDYQGHGIASKLIGRLHTIAQDNHYEEIYLLTTDAENYFKGELLGSKSSKNTLDYQSIEREYAPLSIVHSSQFSELCPASAVLMKKQL
ncbi:MAG: GNAT family N-acetyltransferase [Gammaproteobacteria bacterium]|nr:GNAT family N-acetyltransferase [Gammaproteobacteria bacterium]